MSTNEPAKPPEETGAGLRLVVRIFLVLLLVVAAGAFYWDWQARNDSKALFDRLEALDGRKDFENKIITDEVIHQEVGRPPDAGPDPVAGRADWVVETYSWRGGLPGRTYDVRVYYTKGELKEGETKPKLRYSTVTYIDDLTTPDPERPEPPPVVVPEGTPMLLPPGPPPTGPKGDENPSPERPAPENPSPPAEPTPMPSAEPEAKPSTDGK